MSGQQPCAFHFPMYPRPPPGCVVVGIDDLHGLTGDSIRLKEVCKDYKDLLDKNKSLKEENSKLVKKRQILEASWEDSAKDLEARVRELESTIVQLRDSQESYRTRSSAAIGRLKAHARVGAAAISRIVVKCAPAVDLWSLPHDVRTSPSGVQSSGLQTDLSNIVHEPATKEGKRQFETLKLLLEENTVVLPRSKYIVALINAMLEKDDDSFDMVYSKIIQSGNQFFDKMQKQMSH